MGKYCISDEEKEKMRIRERTKRKLFLPLRIVLFPIMLIIRIFKWTYYLDD